MLTSPTARTRSEDTLQRRSDEATKRRRGKVRALAVWVLHNPDPLFLGVWSAIALFAFILLSSGGCWTMPANPGTHFSYGPMRFDDTKDNDVMAKGVDVQWDGGHVKLDEFTIRNNASDVRVANAQQLQVMLEIERVRGEYFYRTMDRFATTFEAALPVLGPLMGPRPTPTTTIETPYGTFRREAGSFDPRMGAAIQPGILGKTHTLTPDTAPGGESSPPGPTSRPALEPLEPE